MQAQARPSHNSFFEAETFLRFRDACAAAGITAPITPGILPIENWQGTKRFAARCATTIPAWVDYAFEKAQRDNRSDLLATAICAELCSELLDCLLYTSPSPRDGLLSRMPSSA